MRDLWYKASAPGSLMLMGEHAVLQNYPALVVALKDRMQATLIPREDRQIHIRSQLGNLECSLDSLNHGSPWQYVLTTIEAYRDELPSGFELNIDSQFSSTLGFGSSAAVVAVTLGVCQQFAAAEKMTITSKDLSTLFERGLNVIQKVQGIGSGADLAASLYGGIVWFQKNPCYIKKYEIELPLVAVYSGSKVKTVEVIKKVSDHFQQKSEDHANILQKIGEYVEEARNALLKQDWQHLGHLMDLNHGCLIELGVSTAILENLVNHLKSFPTIYGAKISGAGLGDSVIGLGAAENIIHGQNIPVQVALEGLVYDN